LSRSFVNKDDFVKRSERIPTAEYWTIKF
jgi:hypothetical protein